MTGAKYTATESKAAQGHSGIMQLAEEFLLLESPRFPIQCSFYCIIPTEALVCPFLCPKPQVSMSLSSASFG